MTTTKLLFLSLFFLTTCFGNSHSFVLTASVAPFLKFDPKYAPALQAQNARYGHVITEQQDKPCGFQEEEYESIHASVNSSTFLDSPRNWLEYCEEQLPWSNHEAGTRTRRGGVYTVLRCQARPRKGLQSLEWHVPGIEFHLQRLTQSYLDLLDLSPSSGTKISKSIAMAIQATQIAKDSLLHALTLPTRTLPEDATTASSGIDDEYRVAMLTILWTPGNETSICPRVHGHVCWAFGGMPFAALEDPKPITVLLPNSSLDSPLPIPNRYQNKPQAKLSSWCRSRRPLELLRKSPGEVLLTRTTSAGTLELLEGLTSNLFVLMENRTVLCTPPSDRALPGYVRQGILDLAKELGVRVEEQPLYFHDVPKWDEAFMTSSIRLVAPVERMLGPTDGKETTIWTPSSDDCMIFCRSVYRKLLEQAKRK